MNNVKYQINSKNVRIKNALYCTVYINTCCVVWNDVRNAMLETVSIDILYESVTKNLIT